VLREELSALPAEHLEDIISTYALSPLRRGPGAQREGVTEGDLVRAIVDAVRERRVAG
jgi:hypothetical protein